MIFSHFAKTHTQFQALHGETDFGLYFRSALTLRSGKENS